MSIYSIARQQISAAARRVGRIFTQARPEVKIITVPARVTPSGAASGWSAFSVEQDRQSQIEDAYEMYKNDPRVARAIDITANDAFMGWLKIDVKGSDRALSRQEAEVADIIAELEQRLEIEARAPTVAKEFLLAADCFMRLKVSQAKGYFRVAGFDTLPASTMRVLTDDKGQWEYGPERAFGQVNSLNPLAIEYAFPLWEVVQVPWNKVRTGDRYGWGLLFSGRGNWKKLTRSEEDHVIRRRVRAPMRLHHKIGGDSPAATWDQIEEYKEHNKESIADPMAPWHDYWTNAQVDIKPIEGDPRLGDIEDIYHLQEQLFAGLGLPAALLGWGRYINRDVLEKQEVEYLRFLMSINTTFWHGYYQIIRLELLLRGINPDTVEIEPQWAEKSVEDKDKRSLRAVTEQQAGHISMRTARIIEGHDPDEEEARIAEESVGPEERMAAEVREIERRLKGGGEGEEEEEGAGEESGEER